MLKKIVLYATFLFSSASFGWGAKGHQIVSYVGGQLSVDGQSFFAANLNSLRQLSTVPDRTWKASATRSSESPNHFFQIDSYYSSSQYDQLSSFPSVYADAVNQYTEKVLLKNGTAPWRTRQLYQFALQAFKTGDFKSGLEYAGAMSHYIGDLSQPLHVSENYDGQKTGNSGIHSYFETTLIKDEFAIRDEVLTRAQKLLKDPNFIKQFNGTLTNTLYFEIERSIQLKDLILKNDTQLGRTSKGAAAQLNIAKDRLADGAATFSLILNKLWKETGLISQATPLTIQDPDWVRPDFSKLPLDHANNGRRLTSETMSSSIESGDDCSLE